MKILRVLPSMDMGGIERGVYDFAVTATQTGHTVIIASGYGSFIPSLKEKGVGWHDVPTDRKTLPVFFRSCRSLKEIIKSEKPDIVHAESRFPCRIVYRVMKSFPGIPWVTGIHNFHRGLYGASVGKGNLVIAVSNALKEHAVETLGIPGEKIRVVYNGIDESFLRVRKTPSRDFTAGMIARFTAWKGHFFFLEAVKTLLGQGIGMKALIAGSGSGSYRTRLEKWISANGMEETVRIVTMDAVDALKEIDVLAVPSLEPEGFGRTVAEAQMSGTPVIGTNLGAIPEIIEDGRTGFLVEPGNAVQLAERIKFVCRNPRAVAAVTEAARVHAVKNFTISHITEKILDVYRELL